MRGDGQAEKLQLGVRTFAALAGLTAVEWLAARWPGALLWLVAVAAAKTALIAEVFMHWGQLVRREGD